MQWCEAHLHIWEKKSKIKTNTLAYWLVVCLWMVHLAMRQSGMAMAWISGIWAIEGNVEDLGSTSMQIISFIGLLEPLLVNWLFVCRGLDHPERCPLCDLEEKTVKHLLTSCVSVRSVWFSVLSIVGLQHLAPGLENYRTVVSCFTVGSQFISQGLELFGCVSGIVYLET